MTRREFVERSARKGLSAYAILSAWGFIAPAPVKALPQESTRKNKRILILGAGLAGMTAAYELQKLGYSCQILEARDRAGGRVWTIRGGSTETELGGETQTAQFAPGHYLNAGAARIPHHHEVSLHYCRELHVPLEVFVNANEASFCYASGTKTGKRVRMREYHTDMRGYVTELLAKAIQSEALDQNLEKEDADQLLAYLKAEGELNSQFQYRGSERRGYGFSPGASEALDPSDPWALKDIMDAGFLHPAFANVGEYTYHQQPTLLQPQGGMDQLVQALKKKVGRSIMYRSEVLEIQKDEQKVSLTFRDAAGNVQKAEAEYAICTLPLTQLRKIKNNFSGEVKRTIDFVSYMKTGKIGIQFKRRFWEEDEQIFGGISKTNQDITQIFYPSYGFLGAKGVLKGYYNFHERAERFADLSLSQRIEKALQEGEKIHPQYRQTYENAFSLAWHKIPFSEGGWAHYSQKDRKRLYPSLLRPEGSLYFAGEHTTYLNAWMAGAFESARRVVDQMHRRIEAS